MIYSKVALASALALGLTAASGLASNIAEARSATASLGTAVGKADRGCFQMSSGAMRNECTTAKKWEVPLVVENIFGLGLTVQVRAATPNVAGASAVCGIAIQNADGTGAAAPATQTLGQNQNGTLTFNVVLAPGQNANAFCTLTKSAKMISVTW